jgi:hypothetical protein
LQQLYQRDVLVYYPLDEEVPLEDVVKPGFRELVFVLI